MNGTIRVALIDARPAADASAAFAEAGFALLGAFASAEDFLASELSPDAIVLDGSASDGLARGVRSLMQDSPDACVIVTDTSAAAVSHGVAAGARGFLLKPYTSQDLAGVLAEALDSIRMLRRDPSAGGNVVAVYSPKGGAGCSTIAVGLAVLSAARPATSVALVDLDLQFGDVAVMLDVRSSNSIIDLLGRERLDAALIEDTFVRHASGVWVLPAPCDVATATQVDPAAVESTVRALREHFDLVVCDLWSSLDDLTSRILRSADSVVLVTKPELPALKNLSRVLAAKELGLELDGHTLIVANRLPEQGGLSQAEIEHSLSLPVSVAIPSDTGPVVDAINRGIAVVDPRVRSRVLHPYQELAHAVWDAVGLAQRTRRDLVHA